MPFLHVRATTCTLGGSFWPLTLAMPRLVSVLLVSLLLVAGCRETITEPTGLDNPTFDPPTSTDVTRVYIKGPTLLTSSSPIGYLAQLLTDESLRYYQWNATGEGEILVEIVDPEGRDRLIDVTAIRTGTVYLTVRAYDSEGREIGYGQKVIEISSF